MTPRQIAIGAASTLAMLFAGVATAQTPPAAQAPVRAPAVTDLNNLPANAPRPAPGGGGFGFRGPATPPPLPPLTAPVPFEPVHTITWDKNSLMIDGERQYIFAGEFHPFRLPSPDLWRDILQKMKASGLNAVSIYFDWGYHTSKPGEYDFTGIRDMDLVLKMAAEEGLYVIARPGPYVNAELTRGGFPSWLVTQQGRARSDAADYMGAVNGWMSGINKIIAKHQITNGGGTVIAYQIENELDSTATPQMRMMTWLRDKARSDGITVPVYHNDKSHLGVWVPPGSNVPGTVEGPVDIYGFDGYPGGSCRIDGTPGNPSTAPDWGIYGNGGARGAASASPNTPGFTAEYGNGWFDYWNSNGTYACTALHRGPEFERVFYGTNVANDLTIQNFYITFGGTNWGWLGAPVVFTSYDYGAAINEARVMRPKALVLKQMGEFLQSVKDMRLMNKADPITPSNPRVRVYHNSNPATGSHFYFVVHSPSNQTTDESFTWPVSTKDGDYTVQGRINGQDGKMLMAAYDMGGQHLVYSTSEIQTHLPWNGGDLALLYGRSGEAGETVLRYKSAPKVEVLEGAVQSSFDAARGDLKLGYTHNGLARVRISGGGRPPLTLLLADAATGQTFWRDENVLLRGSAMLRNAVVKGSSVALTGDTDKDSAIEVFAPRGVRTVTWNSARVETRATPTGSLASTQDLAGPEAIVLPDLGALTWRTAGGSPEADPAYDDSSWIVADRRGQSRPAAVSGPALNMDLYGFHEGDVWYRGHYTSDGSAQRLTVQYGGGGVGMVQVFADGKFIGQNELFGIMQRPITTGMATFLIPAQAPGEHVVSVMVRNNGHNWDLDNDDAHKEARGLVWASFGPAAGKIFGTDITWKIQGTKGGEDIVDKVRGVSNAGGLAGERDGWTLPGFPDQSWATAHVPDTKATAGTVWYRTSFDLDLPKGHDVSLGLSIGDPDALRSVAEYRTLIFVNGWNMGQFIAHVGPQRTFVIPTGIINPNGRNTLAIAVTSDGEPGNALEAVKLVNLHTVRGGLPVSMVAAPVYKH